MKNMEAAMEEQEDETSAILEASTTLMPPIHPM